MASFPCSLLVLPLVILVFTANAQNPPALQIRKDPKTTQFYTTLHMGSNRAPIRAIVDLGGPFLWFSCNDYASNTYVPTPCGSAKCEAVKGIGCFGCNLPPRPGCTNDTCAALPYNPYLDMLVSQGFAEDTLFYYAKGINNLSVPDFAFSCMDKEYLQGLASGATAMLGLARTETSFHKQVAGRFNQPDKFSICFPSSSGVGKLSVGPGLVSGIVKSLQSTPLIINPVSTYPIFTTGDKSDEYFIGVRAIRVSGEPLSLKSSYFSIDRKGVGGTKISTIRNFTALHDSIYKPFTRAFVKAAANMKIKSVAAVGSFRVCFSLSSISKGPSGPLVPDIDLVLPGKDVHWRISGANSMVEIDRKTACLGFVNGGREPRTAIVIGAHQLEENYVEFDLVSSSLRFSSSLLVQNKSCSSI